MRVTLTLSLRSSANGRGGGRRNLGGEVAEKRARDVGGETWAEKQWPESGTAENRLGRGSGRSYCVRVTRARGRPAPPSGSNEGWFNLIGVELVGVELRSGRRRAWSSCLHRRGLVWFLSDGGRRSRHSWNTHLLSRPQKCNGFRGDRMARIGRCRVGGLLLTN